MKHLIVVSKIDRGYSCGDLYVSFYKGDNLSDEQISALNNVSSESDFDKIEGLSWVDLDIINPKDYDKIISVELDG